MRKTREFDDLSRYTAAMMSAIALTSVTGPLLCVSYGIAGFLR